MDTSSRESLVGDEFAVETAPSPSAAKKQRREDTPEPPSSVEEETDPRSEIKVYKYDSDVEDDSDGMHEMTEKEYEEYHRQIEESEGFEVMHFPRSFSCGLMFPVSPEDEFWGVLKNLSELALKEYNNKEVVKANALPVAGLRYYITFDVKDADAADGNTREFQAHVWDGIGHIEVDFCRPKSTTQASEIVNVDLPSERQKKKISDMSSMLGSYTAD
ncbi:hypothetical protein RHGRI_005286 [Rhododendron griersonianum]|uniref:Cystatin domain-containing protein n=1 Tax=Rhododendron griersonianum TaxID=479676 RepID=A0AAV6LC05_9ERIC|nr:hypothetical protein RHGRI_005286 [Rhododendron griersonianum]